MKKFFFSFAAVAAMFLMVGCGGSDSDNNSSSSSKCDSNYDYYKCSNSSRYVCLNGSWSMIENCPYGCDYSTGRCNSSSGGGNGGGGNYSECDYGDYKCDGNSSYRCSGGSWSYDEYCSNGCSYSTGKCNSGSGSGGNYSECDYGDYKCDGNSSYRCSGGSWSYDEYCSNGCSYSTGKCNSSSGSGSSSSEHSPCPPKLTGSVSGSSVKLSWSYSSSSGCGTPTTATLKYYNDSYGSWEEVKSSSASSFKSYTLSVSTYGYYDSNAGQTLLKAGVLVENEAGSDSASCYCFIDDKNCSCY